MNQQEIAALARHNQLIDRCAHLKPSVSYARAGVRGGIIIAYIGKSNMLTNLLLAIHGRLDDRVWVSPGKIALIAADGSWQIEGRYLTDASAKELAADMEQGDLAIRASRTVRDNLERFGL